MKWIGLARATMRNQGLAAAMCAALAACGGDDGGGSGGDGDNRALDMTPDYGEPSNATAQQAGVMQTGLSSAVSVSSTPNGAAALVLASTSLVTTTLIGPTLGFAAPGAAPALGGRRGGYPDCVTVSDRTFTYDDCEVSFGGSTTVTDGRVNLSDDNRTVSWDLNVTVDLTFGGFTSHADYHQTGTLTIADSTITGEILAELSATSTSGQSTFEYGVDEALLLDLGYQVGPPCVIGGTLEARRVWTTRPEGFTAEGAPDGAALVTWTGCGEATIARSR